MFYFKESNVLFIFVVLVTAFSNAKQDEKRLVLDGEVDITEEVLVLKDAVNNLSARMSEKDNRIKALETEVAQLKTNPQGIVFRIIKWIVNTNI